MAEINYPLYSVSHDEEMQFDSTKRCLFPEEDESSLSGLPYLNIQSGGIESPSKTRDGSDQTIARKLPEETRKSPISVVSVFCSGDSTMDIKREKDSDTEEQTVIEVQYIEAGHRDCNIDVVMNSHTDKDENSPKRENDIEEALNNSKHSPSDLVNVRARPLLDIEKTPSRSRRKKKKNTARTPIFGCGRGALSMCDDSSHQLVERTITDFLEDGSVSTPDAFKTTCHDWQAWSYLGFGRKESPTDATEQIPSKENIRSVLRRRTSHSLRVRKSNVRQLKQNLAPFAPSPARSPARAPGLFRNRSFSVSDHQSAIVRVSKDKKRVRRSFTDVLQLCTMYESIELDSPDLIRKYPSNKVNDDDLSYGSDPEDFTRRRPNSGAKAAAVVAATADSLNFEQSKNLCHHQNSFPSPSRSLLDVHNEDEFSNIVQEIFNKTTTLVLHPLLDSNKYGSVQLGRPVAVDAWLERGQHLSYALIQPKWIWKAKPRVDAGSQSSVRQKMCLQSIELLDITRILKMDETERWSQSFAKPSHCFFVKSIHDEEFCFEAKSRLERDRVVRSLKFLIARFGAKVLTGDPQVYYEFFWINDAVPGKAPNLQEAFVDDLQ